MRDSFLGLHSKPKVKPAPFPDRELGIRLVSLYFEHANPQIPILHRGEFTALFEKAYAPVDRAKSAREQYMLNIVFAIGAGIIMEDSGSGQGSGSSATKLSPAAAASPASPLPGKHGPLGQQHQPEECKCISEHLSPYSDFLAICETRPAMPLTCPKESY